MVGENETRLARAERSGGEQPKRWTEQAVAFGLGMFSFAGWAGSLALDGTIFKQNALGSLLMHLPLMLLPAALVLAFGLGVLSFAGGCARWRWRQSRSTTTRWAASSRIFH